MKVGCISDLHGMIPEKVPENIDILVIAGDVCPDFNTTNVELKKAYQLNWLNEIFIPWVNHIEDSGIMVVYTWGNHDWVGENLNRPDLKKGGFLCVDEQVFFLNGKTDEQAIIWGSPWVGYCGNWAFCVREEELERRWKLIPENTDILVCHSPPWGIGDFSLFGHETCGSHSLLVKIQQLSPKLVVFGHIHEGRGVYKIGDTICVNASHVNIKYEPVHPIIVVEM